MNDTPTVAFDGDVVAALCSGCEHALKRDSGVYCTGPVECRTNKAALFALDDLFVASAHTGLPAKGLLRIGEYTSLDEYGRRETLRRLLAGDGCEHVGLRWVPQDRRYAPRPYPEFPQAEPVCSHGQGKKCRCLLADQRAKAAEGEGKTTASALKLILGRAVPILAAALLEVDEGLLRHVLAKHLHYSLGPSSTTLAWSRQELAEQVAERLVRNVVQEWRSVNENRRLVTTMFTDAGLADPFPVASDDEAQSGIERKLDNLFEMLERHQKSGIALIPPSEAACRANLASYSKTVNALPAGAERERLLARIGEIQTMINGDPS